MNIAFISSALSPEDKTDTESFDFFAVLLNGIVNHAQDKFQVVVFIPEKKGEASTDQERLVRQVLSDAENYHAIVIAPFKTDTVSAEIKNHFENASVPDSLTALVFVDKNIDPTDLGPRVNANLVVKNVCCDNEEGGREAARIILESFHSEGVDPDEQRFMVLQGLEGGGFRAAGFEGAIKNARSSVVVSHPDSKLLNFTRSKARRWMDQQLQAWVKGKSNAFGNEIDGVAWGIFACNDEMALGIRSSVAELYRLLRGKLTDQIQKPVIDEDHAKKLLAKVLFLQRIRIVGFDGIAAALDLIEKSDANYPEWLIGTIRAQVEQQSKEAINWLKLIHESPALSRSQENVKKVPVSAVVRV